MAFSQFYTFRHPFSSLLRTIGVIFSSLLRLFLGRSLRYSFAFTGEDRIIESILKPTFQYQGYYVEVGANHPKFLSNSYGLYRRGWRGVCIDANEALITKYAYYRPKDLAICALVSDKAINRTFYKVQNNVLSTTSPEGKDAVLKEGLEVQSIEMKSKTLNQILAECSTPNTFDLLSVDAEEHDLEVLQGLDFNQFQPKLVVVEDENFDWEMPEKSPIYCLMKQHDYQLEGFVLKNLYFVKIGD